MVKYDADTHPHLCNDEVVDPLFGGGIIILHSSIMIIFAIMTDARTGANSYTNLCVDIRERVYYNISPYLFCLSGHVSWFRRITAILGVHDNRVFDLHYWPMFKILDESPVGVFSASWLANAGQWSMRAPALGTSQAVFTGRFASVLEVRECGKNWLCHIDKYFLEISISFHYQRSYLNPNVCLFLCILTNTMHPERGRQFAAVAAFDNCARHS